jgi:hypothetical protein
LVMKISNNNFALKVLNTVKYDQKV